MDAGRAGNRSGGHRERARRHGGDANRPYPKPFGLGSTNEPILSADIYLTDPDQIPDLGAVSLHLYTFICGQLEYATPGEATRVVLAGDERRP